MSFFEKAKQAADRAAEQAKLAAAQAGVQAKAAAAQAGVQAKAAGEKVRRGLTHERLAQLIVKATALQERTNDELRAKGSPYRIQEITVTASIPPNIGFTIARLGDAELGGRVVESVDILAKMGEDAVLDVEEQPPAPLPSGPDTAGATS
jgi:hypothetical protein